MVDLYKNDFVVKVSYFYLLISLKKDSYMNNSILLVTLNVHERSSFIDTTITYIGKICWYTMS